MKLSIITINYNNKAGLEKTAQSIISQTSHDFEWVIIDGGSTDGSKEVIEVLADGLSMHEQLSPFKGGTGRVSFWCSEPDKGIYNAMNKGIAHTTGEYLLFLNSGDNLHDENVIKEFHELSHDEDIIAGDITLDGLSDQILCSPNESELDFDYMRFNIVRHSAAFFKASLFKVYGLYDESYHIVSDLKFFLDALIKYNCSYSHWHRVVSDFNTEGISQCPDADELHQRERQRVFEEFLPRYYKTLQKRDQRIKELDKPLLTLIKEKLYWKFKNLFRRSK